MYTALAIITDNNKVLIGKLKSQKMREYGGIEYVFPSAQAEKKENIIKTLLEEVKMQSDLDVAIVDKIGERIHPITHNLTEYYLCKNISEHEMKVSKDADIEVFVWVSTSELPKYMSSLFEKVREYLQTRFR